MLGESWGEVRGREESSQRFADQERQGGGGHAAKGKGEGACSERQGEGAMPGGGGMQQKAKVFEQIFQDAHFAEHFGFLWVSVKGSMKNSKGFRQNKK